VTVRFYFPVTVRFYVPVTVRFFWPVTVRFCVPVTVRCWFGLCRFWARPAECGVRRPS
jgi:hypothetical protein